LLLLLLLLVIELLGAGGGSEPGLIGRATRRNSSWRIGACVGWTETEIASSDCAPPL